MTLADMLGWAACLTTLTTFVQRRMVRLRAAAILANVFFIAYAAIGHYPPILALHLTLLPINGQRLFLLLADRSSGQANSGAAISDACGNRIAASAESGAAKNRKSL